MRFGIGAGIGLIGLLITMGIGLYVWSSYTAPVASRGMTARDDAARIAGVDEETGMKNSDSITLAAQDSGGRLRGILVTAIVANGPMQKQMGLAAGDVIVEIGMAGSLMKVSDYPGGADMAIASVYEAPQRKQQLAVMRGGQRIVLPMPPGAAAPPATPVPAASPGNPSPTPAPTPAPTNPPKKNTLHDQLDAITKPR